MDGAAKCVRCNRRLTDPESVAREMGPDCWAASGGGVFSEKPYLSEIENAECAERIRTGGEIDVGVNWQYWVPAHRAAFPMRISVRHQDGVFQAFGVIALPGITVERLFAAGEDFGKVYAAAVTAGPRCNAQAYQARKKAATKARAEWRKAQKKTA
jgi:hypothetical protein